MIALGLFLILCGLQLADLVTTYALIALGIGREANPIARRLMDSIGVMPALVILKAIVIGPPWYFLDQPFMPKLLGIMVGFYVLVVHNNLRIFIKAGRR
jgi:hypothetical protein